MTCKHMFFAGGCEHGAFNFGPIEFMGDGGSHVLLPTSHCSPLLSFPADQHARQRCKHVLPVLHSRWWYRPSMESANTLALKKRKKFTYTSRIFVFLTLIQKTWMTTRNHDDNYPNEPSNPALYATRMYMQQVETNRRASCDPPRWEQQWNNNHGAHIKWLWGQIRIWTQFILFSSHSCGPRKEK